MDAISPTLTINETAKLLRLGRNQVYEAARRGELPTMRIGKRVLVLAVPLNRMLSGGNAQEVEQRPE